MNDSDLQALDDIWPIGRQLVIPDGGTVVIAGAYRGRYMHYVAERYPKAGLILGFEPQQKACKEAARRIAKYNNCFVICEALGTCTEYPKAMGKSGTDGCSFISSEEPIEKVQMIEFSEAMKRHDFPNIDCFICNMEGYEYTLLGHLFNLDIHKHIKSMAVQFHSNDGIPDREKLIGVILDEYYGEPIESPGWYYWRKQ